MHQLKYLYGDETLLNKNVTKKKIPSPFLPVLLLDIVISKKKSQMFTENAIFMDVLRHCIRESLFRNGRNNGASDIALIYQIGSKRFL